MTNHTPTVFWVHVPAGNGFLSVGPIEKREHAESFAQLVSLHYPEDVIGVEECSA